MGKKPHQCSICDYNSSDKRQLKQHIASVHEGKKPHECSICDYTSSKKGNLKQHIQSETSNHEENKPHM